MPQFLRELAEWVKSGEGDSVLILTRFAALCCALLTHDTPSLHLVRGLPLKKRLNRGEYAVMVVDHPASDSHVILSRRHYHPHSTSEVYRFLRERARIGFKHREIVFPHK